jgi:hypothetical protein
VLKHVLLVVEPEQQRPDKLISPRLVPPEAGHDTIGRACVLHLDHRALPGLVNAILRLHHYAIETSPFESRQPVRGDCTIPGHRRQIDWWSGIDEKPFETLASLALWRGTQIPALDGEEVERDKRCRRLLRKLRDPRRRGMQAQLQHVEVETVRSGNHYFPVEDAVLGEGRQKDLETQSREIRPTWARRATPRRRESRWQAWRASARWAAQWETLART